MSSHVQVTLGPGQMDGEYKIAVTLDFSNSNAADFCGFPKVPSPPTS